MATKISDTEIEMEKITPEVRTTVRYERGFIEGQIKAITQQLADYTAARQVEIDECSAIIAEMDKLGIKSKEE